MWIWIARCKQCAVDQYPVNLACVAWWFWLGAQKSQRRAMAEKPRGAWGGSNCYYFSPGFAAHSRAPCVVFVVSVVLSTKPSCYAGYCKLGNTNLLGGNITVCLQIRPCPHVSMFVWTRILFFRVVWPTFYTYRVKAVTENVFFQKRHSTVENFENTNFSFTCASSMKHTP